MAKKKVDNEELNNKTAEEKATEATTNAGEEKVDNNQPKAEKEGNEPDTASEEAGEETNAESAQSEEEAVEGKKDKKDQLIDELKDQYKRTLAEFDNYRKRTDKEKAAMFEVGAKNIIEKILPVIDSFERGLATVPEDEKANPFVEGMDKIYKQLVKQLNDAGVKEIEAMDKEFDPNLHNAVMHCEDENVGENIIVEVFQKGYTYKESVVRHSMVRVAN